MKRKYNELQTKLFHEEIDRPLICKAIGRKHTYVNERFAGNGYFNTREMYVICALAKISPKDIEKYFPPEEMGLGNGAIS